MGWLGGDGNGDCGYDATNSVGMNSCADAESFGGRVGVYFGGEPSGGMNGGAVGDNWLGGGDLVGEFDILFALIYFCSSSNTFPFASKSVSSSLKTVLLVEVSMLVSSEDVAVSSMFPHSSCHDVSWFSNARLVCQVLKSSGHSSSNHVILWSRTFISFCS